MHDSGGLEMLFDNQTKHRLRVPSQDSAGKSTTVAFLIRYLCENVMKDSRRELFVLKNGSM